MREIAFTASAPEVLAMLAGQTRQVERPLKRQPPKPNEYQFSAAPDKAIWKDDSGLWWLVPDDVEEHDPSPHTLYEYRCPYGQPGDHLWVRETWAMNRLLDVPPSHVGHGEDGLWWKADHSGFRPLNAKPGRWLAPVTMPRWASRITLKNDGVYPKRKEDGRWVWVVQFEVMEQGR